MTTPAPMPSPSRRRIGILGCGEPPPALRAVHGRYADMVARLVGPGCETEVFDVPAGQLPPDPAACDGYVITGSAAGVYDALPWIAPLLGFLRAARGRAKLVGICFGHQAMAQALGGEVTKSPKGWGLGVHRYDVVARCPWMDDATVLRVPASHQDQVIVAPRDARVIVASDFTPLAGLDYGDAISFQFHPEFSAAFGRALIEAGRERYGPLADAAIASYADPDDAARVASWIGRFLAAP